MTHDCRNFIGTGIPELNSMLTRCRDCGIAVPCAGGAASATHVLRGPVGSGKSAIAALIARNIHNEPIRSPQNGPETVADRKAFAIYLSFTQLAEGVHAYLERILGKSATSEHGPLILSPGDPRQFRVAEGLDVLRRMISEVLIPFCPPLFGTTGSNSKEVRLHMDRLLSSGRWTSALPLEKVCGPCEKEACLIPFVIVDPINIFMDYRDSRAVVAELFATFRTLRYPFFAILEDSGSAADSTHRQLTSDIEFEADVALHFGSPSSTHKRRSLEIVKNRNSQPIHGGQSYRVENPEHSLWPALSQQDRKEHSGLLIFRSIHWFLSRSRMRPGKITNHLSGIPLLDVLLGSEGPKAKPCLPSDSFILVRGDKGGHKLSISFNILMGGMGKGSGSPGNTLLLYFGEDTSMDVERIGLCCSKLVSLRTGPELASDNESVEGVSGDPKKKRAKGNRERVRWLKKVTTREDMKPETKEADREVGDKLTVEHWRSIHHARAVDGPSLFVVTFKPGHLSPEEFLWVVETLLRRFKEEDRSISRLLIENTAHLQMRFPELHAEKMLFPALSSITRFQNVMLIVTHVNASGPDKDLDHGLAASADFILDVQAVGKDVSVTPCSECSHMLSRKQITWARLAVSNVRGKVYLRREALVSVIPCKGCQMLPRSSRDSEINTLVFGQEESGRGEAR